MYREFRRYQNGNGQKRKKQRKKTDDPELWQDVLFRQFQRKYRKTLNTNQNCRHCSGPIAEAMLACPWCGVATEPKHQTLSFPAHCPRCHKGSKCDWKYCAWCYGPAFEVETSRHYKDRRYSAKCSNSKCRGELMPFMRYCPWCRSKTRKAWKIPGSKHTCGSCGWGVLPDYWSHCPWCAKKQTSR